MATSTTTIVTSSYAGNHHLCNETDFVQTNETPEAFLEKHGNRRPTSAAAVSPTTSVLYSNGILEPKSTSTTYDDDNEVKPISLDDFDEATENPLIRRISIQLVKEMSVNRNDTIAVNGVGIPTNDGIDNDKNETGNETDNEQDWTKKIVAIPDSSGNLIEDLEDLHTECDELSTSSMMTIIGSEQSSCDGADGVDDDLEGIFSLEEKDEKDDEGENDDNGDDDDRGSADPLHSKFFVVFGDDYDGRKNNNGNNGGSREIIDSTNTSTSIAEKTPPSRPKTSRINPMTGQKSLTDDIQEWREKVLSTWTLKEPKKRKKYTKRKWNRKIATSGQQQHAYPLRRTTEGIKLVVPASVGFLESSTKSPLRKKSRLLQNIAAFNQPSITNSYGDGSVSSTMIHRCNDTAASTDKAAATRQEEDLPKSKQLCYKPLQQDSRAPRVDTHPRVTPIQLEGGSSSPLKPKQILAPSAVPEKKCGRPTKPKPKVGPKQEPGRPPKQKKETLTIKIRIGEDLPKGVVPHEREMATPSFPKPKQLHCKPLQQDGRAPRVDAHPGVTPIQLEGRSSSLKPKQILAPSSVPEKKRGRPRKPKPKPKIGPKRKSGRPLKQKKETFTIIIRIGDAMFVPADAKEDELQIPVRLIESHECSAPDHARNGKQFTSPSPSSATCSLEAEIDVEENKQKKHSDCQLESQPTKQLQKKIETPPPNTDRTPNNCSTTRIAKKFFIPTRGKANDKLKIFFGTIVNKRIHKEANGTCSEVWHVAYDDGDEEDLDKIELKEALDLYDFAKRWDKKHRDKLRSSAGKNKEKPNDEHATEKGKESGSHEESQLKESKEQDRPLALQRSYLMTVSKSSKSFDVNQKTVPKKKRGKSPKSKPTVGSKRKPGRPPEKKKVVPTRNKQSDSNHKQQEMSRGCQSRHVDLSCDDVVSIKEASDDDSIHVLDVVDLTKDSKKIRNVVDIVDLTINFEKKDIKV